MTQLGTPGTPLGILSELNLTDVPFELGPGDLLLYTDGAIEGRPRPGSSLEDVPTVSGEAELAQALANSHGVDATATIDHVTGVLHAHHDGWAIDDTALLALRVQPAPPTMPP